MSDITFEKKKCAKIEKNNLNYFEAVQVPSFSVFSLDLIKTVVNSGL